MEDSISSTGTLEIIHVKSEIGNRINKEIRFRISGFRISGFPDFGFPDFGFRISDFGFLGFPISITMHVAFYEYRFSIVPGSSGIASEREVGITRIL